MCSTGRMPIARPKQFPSGFLVAVLLAASGLLWAVMFFGPLAHLERLASGEISRCRRWLWVRSGHFGTSTRCLLYPQKRTSLSGTAMSALCQKRTWEGRGSSLAIKGSLMVRLLV
jgi:hypothetical protein